MGLLSVAVQQILSSALRIVVLHYRGTEYDEVGGDVRRYAAVHFRAGLQIFDCALGG